MKKFWQFLGSNFQIVNFFLASIIIGGLFGFWYLPQSSQKENTNINNPPPSVTKITPTNSPETATESPLTITNSPRNNPETPIDNTSVTPSSTSNNSTASITPPATVNNTTIATLPTTKQEKVNNPVNSSQSPEIEDQELAKINYLLSSTYFGHFPFQEAPQARLVNMGKYYNRTEYLDREAGEAFLRMKAAAKTQGVELILISGFRSISSQTQLFQKQIQKRGSKEEAVKLSAPPGHSEHHTGYALDIGDGKQPSLDLKTQFQSTQAYQWLSNNAHKYGFELSFPPNNLQGVSFEPWHWRFVASDRANRIFAMPRHLLYQNK
ncbi:D-alanyl-D-alanine carboxypeptidase family protein [Cyanobacterium aponinum]|uniref:D-alanyl-D-alanine carboxypeptidase family protein n=1 Tax=Cyanobacterium aponinum 0216 TaxID=2676140 RepID=A0A844GW83_9CHRO|nr:D-alanyl-D-alanine carboxypeptidase family protein [Cyanobacterium aponinum]MTF39312.1 D-alanyl-D-alanine carboxypeptidase family protein [Cyanobacterium aponinum 0216]